MGDAGVGRWRAHHPGAFHAIAGAAVGAVALLLMHLGVLEWLLAPVALIEFFLLLLVSGFLPKPESLPSVVPVPQFHWLAMVISSLALILLFGLLGWAAGALARARSRSS